MPSIGVQFSSEMFEKSNILVFGITVEAVSTASVENVGVKPGRENGDIVSATL